MKTFQTLFCLAAMAGPAIAQSTISDTKPHAYMANAGWLNFRPSPQDGTVVTETYLTGYAYGANIGWVMMGYIRPDNYHTYSNASATDFGVNVSPSGQLTGHAYSANVGWITFEQTYGQPRINLQTGQFLGYAYSANVGWIALNASGAGVTTSTITAPDSDGDGISNAWEYQNFADSTTANGASDFDRDGVSDLREFLSGTDPKDPTDNLRIISITRPSATTTTLTFTSKPGHIYQIETDADLASPWTDSGLGLFYRDPADSTTTTKTITHGPGSRLFFRAGARRPLKP